jgi:hypothetical protein
MTDVKKELEEAGFVKKVELEHRLRQFNDGLTKYEQDDYLSKKHLLDYVDSCLSSIAEQFDISLEG